MVIFKKNGVQARLEFDSLESAQRAKDNLHGCDIYSGCCTLKIEYAKPTKLNVYKNDSESYDFTNPNLGAGGCHLVEQPCLAVASHRPVLLKDPLMGGADPNAAAAAAAAAAVAAVGPLAVAIRPTHHQVYASPAHHQVAVSLGAQTAPINFSTLLTQALPRLTSPSHQLVSTAGSLMASGGQPGPLVSPQSAAGAAAGVGGAE